MQQKRRKAQTKSNKTLTTRSKSRVRKSPQPNPNPTSHKPVLPLIASRAPIPGFYRVTSPQIKKIGHNINAHLPRYRKAG